MAKACAPSSSGLCGRKRPAPIAECADCAPQCELCNSCTPSIPLANRMLNRKQDACDGSRAPHVPPRISVSDVVSPAAAPFTPAFADGRPEAYDHFVAIDWRPRGHAAQPNCPPCGFSYTFGAPGGVRAAISAALERAAAKEARALAALQTDEEIDSDSDSSMGSGLGSSGDSGHDSSSSGLRSSGDSGRDSSSTEPGQCNSTADDALASGGNAGECMPEWSDDVALALARAAGPMLREPVLNELYVEWADPFGGFMTL